MLKSTFCKREQSGERTQFCACVPRREVYPSLLSPHPPWESHGKEAMTEYRLHHAWAPRDSKCCDRSCSVLTARWSFSCFPYFLQEGCLSCLWFAKAETVDVSWPILRGPDTLFHSVLLVAMWSQISDESKKSYNFCRSSGFFSFFLSMRLMFYFFLHAKRDKVPSSCSKKSVILNQVCSVSKSAPEFYVWWVLESQE